MDLLKKLSLIGIQLDLKGEKLTHLSPDLFISIPDRDSGWSDFTSLDQEYHRMSLELTDCQISLKLIEKF